MDSLEEKIKETKRAYKNDWKARNKEKVAEYQRNWARANKDKIKEYQNRYWTKKAQQEGNNE